MRFFLLCVVFLNSPLGAEGNWKQFLSRDGKDLDWEKVIAI